MSAVYISTSSCWATFADGRALCGNHTEGLAVIDARIDALDLKTLEKLCDDRYGDTLAVFGESYATPPAADVLNYDGADNEDEILTNYGADALRKELKDAVRSLATDDEEVDFRFDGRRWIVSTGHYSHGDTSEEFNMISALDLTGVLDDPIDGPEFMDVPATGAAVAVLDDLAATVRRALQAAGVPAAALEAAENELENARNNVAGAARTIRTVTDRLTFERSQTVWDLHTQDMAAASD